MVSRRIAQTVLIVGTVVSVLGFGSASVLAATQYGKGLNPEEAIWFNNWMFYSLTVGYVFGLVAAIGLALGGATKRKAGI